MAKRTQRPGQRPGQPTVKNRAKSNYLRLILANPPLPGTVAIAHIYHDGWCSIWKTGECDCNPEVIYEYPDLRGDRHVQP